MPDLSDFHFIRPEWLLAFVPLLMLLLWLRHTSRGRGIWHAVCDAQLMPFVLETTAAPGRSRRLLLAGIAGTLAILALAGPAWQKLPQPVFRQESALVILMDLSRSMDAGDVRPSRLERALLKLQDLLETRREGQTALVVYAGDAFAVTPLTDDTATISSLVQSLSTSLMPVQGSRPDRAVEQGLALLSQAGVRSGSLLLITDGVEERDAAEIAKTVTDAGHRMSVMGAGTVDGAPIPAAGGGFVKDDVGRIVVPKLDQAALVRLAESAGGVYVALGIQNDDVERLKRAFDAHGGKANAQAAELQTDRWREEGPWLLLLLLPVAMLVFRRGLLALVICIGLQWPDRALAMEWSELWLNPDQLGMRAMENEDYGGAAERFSDRRWKAAAHYRAGDYEKSAAELEELSDPEAVYNRGNALARAGRIDEAIESYRSVLSQQPAHEDARHNLELLEQLRDQQQQQQQGEGGQDQDQQDRQPEAEDGGGQDQQQSGEPQEQSGEPQEKSGPEQRNGGEPQDAEQTESGADGQEPEPQQQGEEERQAKSQDESDSEQDGREDEHTGAEVESESERSEQQQAMEQWLRRVPDDPGGLLRRKFRHQYTERGRNRGHEAQAW